VTDENKHFHEIASEGGGVVLGEMIQQEACDLAQGYESEPLGVHAMQEHAERKRQRGYVERLSERFAEVNN
jgi:hypothetical protein